MLVYLEQVHFLPGITFFIFRVLHHKLLVKNHNYLKSLTGNINKNFETKFEWSFLKIVLCGKCNQEQFDELTIVLYWVFGTLILVRSMGFELWKTWRNLVVLLYSCFIINISCFILILKLREDVYVFLYDFSIFLYFLYLYWQIFQYNILKLKL